MAVNLVVTIVATLIARAAKVADGVDATADSDYFPNEDDPNWFAERGFAVVHGKSSPT